MTSHNLPTPRSTKRARPSIAYPDASFVTVLVGSEQARFAVHECLLTRYSGFFRAALTGRFKEAEDKTVKLEEVQSTTFSFFVHWLYNGHLQSEDKGDDADIVEKFYKHDSPDHGAIVKLYIFGDKYDCPDLRKAAIDLLFIDVTENDDSFPSSLEVALAFENLQLGGPFCRLLVDFMAIYGHEKMVAEELEKYTNVVFMKAVLARFVLAQVEQEDLATMDPELCDYHDHMDDVDREACEKETIHT